MSNSLHSKQRQSSLTLCTEWSIAWKDNGCHRSAPKACWIRSGQPHARGTRCWRWPLLRAMAQRCHGLCSWTCVVGGCEKVKRLHGMFYYKRNSQGLSQMYIHVYCFIVYIDICLELEIVHLKLRPLKLVGSLINHHQFKILANKHTSLVVEYFSFSQRDEATRLPAGRLRRLPASRCMERKDDKRGFGLMDVSTPLPRAPQPEFWPRLLDCCIR